MYVSLHNRSCYSFGLALSRPEHLARFARQQGMPAIALTDLNGVYGAVAFQQACAQVEVTPIVGTELHCAEATLTLLACNAAGYANLCRLISLRHLSGTAPDRAAVCAHADGLICLMGAVSEVGWPDWVNALKAAFGRRVYQELAIHGSADVTRARSRARRADAAGVPVVAVCESRCSSAAQARTLLAVSSIGTLTLLDQDHPDKPAGAWHLRTPQEMQRLFGRRPDALKHTREIAEQCGFTFDLAVNRFPAFAAADGRSAIAHLRARCLEGCRRRYLEQAPLRGIGGGRPAWSEVLQRLRRELGIIAEVGYAEYFLVFDEIVRYCRDQGIATLARGSAADSLICYALGVSHACPFRFDLPFDRFINVQRARFSKLADIDLDLPWDRREQVIGWVYERWGHDRVAMIGCANTYHTRAAVLELGKVFGLPAQEIQRLTRRLGRMHSDDLGAAIAALPEARDVAVDEEPYRTIFQLAGGLSGLPRHWSMHPCGLVVSPEPLTDLVPVQRSARGFLVAQYDMDAVEDLGFIKIDLLGQAGLSVLRDTVHEIERTTGRSVDLARDVDYADPPTWSMIAGGQARGVHHIESPAMTSLLQQCDCRDIDCLTAVVAIIRPGAANQGKKEQFARRCQGLEAPRFAHPALESILGQTYGLMVFEEHILQVATEFAGMDLGNADVLRRALNKQDAALMGRLKQQFYERARSGGRRTHEIEAVWATLEGFCGFMFNKAHSAEYAVEAFQGAWLKRRWPAHYLAAILSNYRGFYAHSPTLPQILYVLEARRLGIGFVLPCVNRSRAHFSVEYHPEGCRRLRPMIRLPVSHIRGLTEQCSERCGIQRQAGPFRSLTDFLHRVRPAPADARLLLDSGALDALGDSRPELFWKLRRWTPPSASHQTLLWADDRPDSPQAPPISLTEPDAQQRARQELDLLGFPISLDPLTCLSCNDRGQVIDWSQYTPLGQLQVDTRRPVEVCGLMVADRINSTARGNLMKFVTLADHSGFIEAMLFPDVYSRFGYLTVLNPILAARGILEPFENRRGFVMRVLQVFPPQRIGAQPPQPDRESNPRPNAEARPGMECMPRPTDTSTFEWIAAPTAAPAESRPQPRLRPDGNRPSHRQGPER